MYAVGTKCVKSVQFLLFLSLHKFIANIAIFFIPLITTDSWFGSIELLILAIYIQPYISLSNSTLFGQTLVADFSSYYCTGVELQDFKHLLLKISHIYFGEALRSKSGKVPKGLLHWEDLSRIALFFTKLLPFFGSNFVKCMRLELNVWRVCSFCSFYHFISSLQI